MKPTLMQRIQDWWTSRYNLRFESQLEHERRRGGLFFTDGSY